MKEKLFIHRLESLRGVAAMMVAVGHSLIVFETFGWKLIAVKLLNIFLFNGWAAVTLFFVLSGFVLGLAIRRAEGSFGHEYFRFSIRRIFRIYPAFIFSTLLVLIYLLFGFSFTHYAAASEWFETFYRKPLTSGLILKNLFLCDTFINPVTWTLQIEMVCSLLLPILHWISLRASSWGKGFFLLGLILLSFISGHQDGGTYLFMFYLGYLLPVTGPQFFSSLIVNPKFRILVTLMAGGVLLCARQLLNHEWSFKTGILLEGLAAWAVIGGILYGAELKIYKALDHSWVRFFGRISYSFYLLHFIVLYIVAFFFFQLIPNTLLSAQPIFFAGILWLVSTALATPLAFLFYTYIEIPFIAYSKEICAWHKSRFPERKITTDAEK